MSKSKSRKEPIVGLVHAEEKLLIQKSLPLFALWKSDLTLAEFKILDVYLSRINSHDPEHRTVKFEKGELEQILGVKRILNKELDERLKHLQAQSVRIPDSDYKKGFTRITLFEMSYAEKDEETGLWTIELMCTPSAMKYIFNVENIKYLRYKLRNVININSRYSYIMFMYLEQNKFRGKWTVSVDKLKEILNCQNEETYKQYKYFNDLVLKKIHKELNQKTECKFDYKPIKKGRNIIAIEITKHSSAIIKCEETKVSSGKEMVTGVDKLPLPVVEVKNEDEDKLIKMGYLIGDNEFLDFFRKEIFESRFSSVETEEIITLTSLKLGATATIDDVRNFIEPLFKRLKVAVQEMNVSKPYNYFKTMVNKEKVHHSNELPNWYGDEGSPATQEALEEAYELQEALKLKEEQKQQGYWQGSDDLPF